MNLSNIEKLLEPCNLGTLMEAMDKGIIKDFNEDDVFNEEYITKIKKELSVIRAKEWRDISNGVLNSIL